MSVHAMDPFQVYVPPLIYLFQAIWKEMIPYEWERPKVVFTERFSVICFVRTRMQILNEFFSLIF